jgi:hypothetical protein
MLETAKNPAGNTAVVSYLFTSKIKFVPCGLQNFRFSGATRAMFVLAELKDTIRITPEQFNLK